MTPKGVWRPHFQSVLRKVCNTDKDGESIGILWNLSSCQTEQSKKFRYNRFSGANLGTFLLQYPKSQMRHNSVAHATAMCRIYNSEDLGKVDYEGKYGKRRFPERKKVLNLREESWKRKHLCKKRIFNGRFPGTLPPLRRLLEKVSGTSPFGTAVVIDSYSEPCLNFTGTLFRGAETTFSVNFGIFDMLQWNAKIQDKLWNFFLLWTLKFIIAKSAAFF